MERELRAFVSDLEFVDSNTPWFEPFVANKTLGMEMMCTPVALAERFLGVATDWLQLHRDYRRYFGITDPVRPATERLEWDVGSLSGRIRNNRGFAAAVRERWTAEWEMTIGPSHDAEGGDLNDGGEGIFRRMVESLHRIRVLRGDGDADSVVVAELDSVAREADGRGRAIFESASDDEQRECQFFIRNFCRAMLWASWLQSDDELRHGSAFWTVHSREEMDMGFIDDVLAGLEDGEAHGLIEGILGRLGTAIAEFDYDSIVADVTDGQFRPDSDGPLSSADVNIIPGRDSRVCCPALVAFSAGAVKSKRMGLHKTLQLVNAHLITCSPDLLGRVPSRACTRIVIVLFDTWDSAWFQNEHRSALEAHHRKGVKFVFLQVGSDRRTLSWIEKDLAK